MKHDGKNKNTMNAIIRCVACYFTTFNNTYIILKFRYLVTSNICIDVYLEAYNDYSLDIKSYKYDAEHTHSL